MVARDGGVPAEDVFVLGGARGATLWTTETGVVIEAGALRVDLDCGAQPSSRLM